MIDGTKYGESGTPAWGFRRSHVIPQLVRRVMGIYRQLPVKPFRSQLRTLLSAYQQCCSGGQVIAEIEGIKYALDLCELIDRSLFFGGAFEPKTAAALRQLTGRGKTVIDVGANIGCHTCLLAKLAEPGQVIAFEPMPWARGKLLRNVSVNAFRNVVVENCALSDVTIKAAAVHFRSSWMIDVETRSTGEHPESCKRTPVQFQTLDSYVDERKIKDIGLIKIDVDGYEAKVLRGAKDTLRNHRPILVMELCSYTLEQVGDSLSELIDFLQFTDYRVFREETFVEFPSKEEILGDVPAGSSINVVCSCTPLVVRVDTR